MTLSAFACAMISAATVKPSVERSSDPSPAIRISPSVMVSPASPASLSTTILSPAATRYCLPPVRTIANMGLSKIPDNRAPRPEGRRGNAGCYIGRGDLSTKGPGMPQRRALVPSLRPQPIAPAAEPLEHARNCRMIDRFAQLVGQQILLADIGNVARFLILGKKMVEGLVLGRTDLGGDRLVPFLAIGED